MQTIVFKGDQPELFSIIRYPDGQKSIILHLDKLDIKMPVTIRCRIKNFADLEILCCLIAALRHNDFSVIRLEFAYLFGVRSDRAFNPGEPNYFRDVLAPIVNGFEIPNIYLYWPFAPLPILNKYLRNCEIIDYKCKLHRDFILIAGDETAAQATAMHFNKWRGNNEITVELHEKYLSHLERMVSQEKEIVILDDICDGGATFIAESKYLKRCSPK